MADRLGDIERPWCGAETAGGPCGRRKGHAGHHATISAHHYDEKDDLREQLRGVVEALQRAAHELDVAAGYIGGRDPGAIGRAKRAADTARAAAWGQEVAAPRVITARADVDLVERMRREFAGGTDEIQDGGS